MSEHADQTGVRTEAAEGEHPAAGAGGAVFPPEPPAGEESFADAEAVPAGSPPGADEPGATGISEPSGEESRPPGAQGESAEEGSRGPSPQDEAAKYLALAQRTQADFENFRKRMARENAQAVDRGVARLAKELLPALDHFELAVKASEGHEEVVRGFAIVRDELVAALGKVGIQPFSPQGEPFDPNEHEAMVQQPAEGAEPGTVLEVYQQGYRINGTVLRPARVVVAA